jgi:hypothetical protein
VTLFCVGVKTGYRPWSELALIKNAVISILDTFGTKVLGDVNPPLKGVLWANLRPGILPRHDEPD